MTIFVGGNHEASNYLQELPYGGWVAPNIYYLGYAGWCPFSIAPIILGPKIDDFNRFTNVGVKLRQPLKVDSFRSSEMGVYEQFRPSRKVSSMYKSWLKWA